MSQKPSKRVQGESSHSGEELTDDQLEGVAGGLELGDIKGESTDKKHKDWISLL